MRSESLVWAAASGRGGKWWWRRATEASRDGTDFQALLEAASGGQDLRDAAGGKGDWFGLRQERLVEGRGGSEQRRHQGMDVTSGRWLRRRVEDNI